MTALLIEAVAKRCEPTGMMTFDKSQMVLFLELNLRSTKNSHLYSANGGRID